MSADTATEAPARRSWSVSAARSYDAREGGCPRQWSFRYGPHRSDETRGDGDFDIYRRVGKLLHAAIEAALRAAALEITTRGQSLPSGTRLRRYHRVARVALGKAWDDEKMPSDSVVAGQVMEMFEHALDDIVVPDGSFYSIEDRRELVGPQGTPIVFVVDFAYWVAPGVLRVVDWKGLALDTPIPTPTGWTTMGDLRVGDKVLDRDGRPTTVTGKSEVHHKRCYRVTFSGDQSVICDDDHLWVVRRGRAPGVETVMQTADMVGDVRGPRGQRHLRVPLAGALDLPERELPVHPYVLGCWLGDGHRRDGAISKPEPELFDHIAACGYQVGAPWPSSRNGRTTRTVRGLRAELSAAGVLHDKHIPSVYLRASREQRLALLRGLMDTDGTANIGRRGECVYTSTDKRLANAVHELVLSLGQAARINEVRHHGYGLDVTAYDVSFRALGIQPFRLARKAERVLTVGAFRDFRMIQSIEEVDTVATQCIAVDSPTRTYLCTEKMIPTHNTGHVDPDDVTHSWQLLAYAALIMAMDPRVRAVEIELYSLRRRRGFVHRPTREQADRALRRLENVAAAADADRDPQPRPGPHCVSCRFRTVCPASGGFGPSGAVPVTVSAPPSTGRNAAPGMVVSDPEVER